ncbi:hypothetical protein Misp02_54050 [Microtetraspora sp. NBRC 16547]|nr:hypothetical protein Misp02_54050 [Microtetraspora sp. NBRC 16547]
MPLPSIVVHDGVTFEVPAGGMTALVGPSGAGKSTVFGLVERFYEPDSGAISVGGRDIRDWPLEELRSALGYVEQDAPILAGTLRYATACAGGGKPGGRDAAGFTRVPAMSSPEASRR